MARYEPNALQEHVEAQIQRIGANAFIVRREHNRLREMWCAARFGIGYGNNITACQIEVDDRDEQMDYDFHLCCDSGRLPFQVTEAMDYARPRDDEYRNQNEEQLNKLQHQAYIGDSTYAAIRIREELQKKINKHYANPERLHMLIYLNANASAAAWPTLLELAGEEAKTFASVWVVTGDLFCCIYGGATWRGQVGWKRIDEN